MHKCTIKDPVYHAEIYLFMSSYDEFCKYLKRYDSEFPNHTDYYPSGKVVRVRVTKKDFSIRKYYLWIPSFDYYGSEYKTLVHEVIHLALMVFDMKGVDNFKDNANEAFCYYADYLFGEFLKAIDKANKKIKTDNINSCREAMDYMKEGADGKK